MEVGSVDWTFFNPKVGARYSFRRPQRLRVGRASSTREPTRIDIFLGEDNATVAHDLHAVKPERLSTSRSASISSRRPALGANLYAMEFRDEIALTGELSDIGLALRKNVDRSYRRGIELSANWQASPMLQLRTAANVSRNRIGTGRSSTTSSTATSTGSTASP